MLETIFTPFFKKKVKTLELVRGLTLHTIRSDLIKQLI